VKSKISTENAVVFIGGVLVGICIVGFRFIDFDAKLTFGDALLSMSTVVLAWIVSVVWRNQQYQQDGVTELLIDRIEIIQKRLQDIRGDALLFFSKTWDDAEWSRKVVEPFREVSNLIGEVEVLSKAYFKTNKLEMAKRAYLRLKTITNSTPSDPPGVSGIVKMEARFTSLRQELVEATIDIFKR